MVPFKLSGNYTLKSLAKEGSYTITDKIAVITDNEGNDIDITMVQKWPVKIPIKVFDSRPRPFRLLETGVRTIDTLNPITEGGTGFVPGPFGSGKTVLQHALSKQAEADIVIVAACGKRANEVVEIFTEFPELDDPRTGRKLMDLTAIISNFYARAGYTYLHNGETGSITFIGTVSPAGGNLKEPVTEATKKAARCFYALSQDRADSKRYPAVDPIDSYSKYLEYDEVKEYLNKNIHESWVENIERVKDILIRGREASEQIDILGDDGVPINYHTSYWKSEVIDFVILQQDAFDEIDATTPIKRQHYMLEKVLEIYKTDFEFDSFEDVAQYFKRMINELKQMNYSDFYSDKFKEHEEQLEKIMEERKVA